MNDLIADPPPAATGSGWQALPPRARALFLLGFVPPLALPPAVAAFALSRVFDLGGPWEWGGPAAAALLGAVAGAWIGIRQYAGTAWCHDREGLALRRGHWWQREVRVPASRVQHLDIKRGPLQRRRRLATLVVHTAGTRDSAVAVHHLDEADAQRLRQALSAQIDHDDD